MIIRKQSWALNKRMGKQSYGCGITGILLWNSKITEVLVVEGHISVVRRQVISVDEWHENGPKSVPQRRSTVTRPVLSWKSIYAPPFSNTDGFYRINELRDSDMFSCEQVQPNHLCCMFTLWCNCRSTKDFKFYMEAP